MGARSDNEYPHNDRALYDFAMVACLAAQRDRRYFVPCDHRYLPVYRHHYAPPLFIIDQPRWRLSSTMTSWASGGSNKPPLAPGGSKFDTVVPRAANRAQADAR